MAQLAVAAVMFVGSVYKGKEQQKLKDREAQAYRDARDRRAAAATREVAEEKRKKEFMYSRALAVAGAQGGSQADPGINALLADLNAEGEYRMLSVLWTGLTEAEGYGFRAEAARREGEAAFEAGVINGITSAVSSYVGMGGDFSSSPFGMFSQSEQMERGREAGRTARGGRPMGFEQSRWGY